MHADLHPGNILVRNSELQYAAPNQLVILDPGEIIHASIRGLLRSLSDFVFAGIVSSLPPTDLDNIRSVFGAVVKGDGYRVGELFLDRSKHFCTDRESFIKGGLLSVQYKLDIHIYKMVICPEKNLRLIKIYL